MRYVFATNNPGKTRELKAIFQESGIDLLTLSDLNLSLSPDETGTTFEENALIKANETAAFLRSHGHSNIVVLADDSGLEVDAMDGRPGVDSALFMGAETPFEVRNTQIIQNLSNTPDEQRTARFVCVITCVFPNNEILTTRAELAGKVALKIQGENGFGYDPILYVPAYGKTVAELTSEEKNKISHRGQAVRQILELLRDSES